MVDYDIKFSDTPRDQILTMLRWANERNDAKAKERKDEYMKLMQMLGRGVGAYMYGQQVRDKADANESWDKYMPVAQKLYSYDLVGATPSREETLDKLKELGLQPYLVDIDKLRKIGADSEFDYMRG